MQRPLTWGGVGCGAVGVLCVDHVGMSFVMAQFDHYTFCIHSDVSEILSEFFLSPPKINGNQANHGAWRRMAWAGCCFLHFCD